MSRNAHPLLVWFILNTLDGIYSSKYFRNSKNKLLLQSMGPLVKNNKQ